MSWATPYIARLKAGETVQLRPRGSSMAPKIASGALVTVAPVDPEMLAVGDIVLCKVGGNQYLHLVKAIQRPKASKSLKFQIGNNRGFINGWTSADCIYGRCVKVEP
jgi:hypothetical protein